MRFIFIRAIRLTKTRVFTLALTFFLIFAGITAVLATNKDLPVTSWTLSDRVIVIDPGHGGIDPGAVGYGGTKEKDIVLQVSKRLEQLLNHAGAKVLMTRETDIDLSTPGSGSLLKRKREDLGKRIALAKKNNADIYLSIHVNAYPSSRWRGAQTFYQTNNAESKKLAETVQSELIRIMGNTTRQAKSGDFYTTRVSGMESIIIEIGFISNPTEAKLMKVPAYQRKLAHAIYSGITKYYSEQMKERNEKGGQ